jgi:hypothetical protein
VSVHSAVRLTTACAVSELLFPLDMVDCSPSKVPGSQAEMPPAFEWLTATRIGLTIPEIGLIL